MEVERRPGREKMRKIMFCSIDDDKSSNRRWKFGSSGASDGVGGNSTGPEPFFASLRNGAENGSDGDNDRD